MPFIIGVLALLGAAYFWLIRMRAAAEMSRELADVASDVMAAARRLGFRRRLNLHPVESLEDPDLAIAGAAMAFLELGGLPTAEEQDALAQSLRSQLGLVPHRAQEMLILGRWLVTESGGAQPGLARLTRRLYKLQGAASLPRLMAVLRDVAAAGRGGVSERQKAALEEISQLYRLA